MSLKDSYVLRILTSANKSNKRSKLSKLLMLKKKKVIEVATHVTRLYIRTKFALNIKTSIQLGLP
jgi:hypothetical protein